MRSSVIDIMLNTLTAVLLCGAVLVISSEVRHLFVPVNPFAQVVAGTSQEWRTNAIAGLPTHRYGSDPVRIVQFGDFGCARSRESYTHFRALAANNDSITYIHRHNPQTTDSRLAAIVAECLRSEGEDEPEDIIYELYERVVAGEWRAIAERTTVEGVARLRTCVEEGVEEARQVQTDIQQAAEYSFPATPLLIIHETKMRGFPGKEFADSVARVALDGRR